MAVSKEIERITRYYLRKRFGEPGFRGTHWLIRFPDESDEDLYEREERDISLWLPNYAKDVVAILEAIRAVSPSEWKEMIDAVLRAP